MKTRTEQAEQERAEFTEYYGDGNCSCHISAPCGSCTHPGNPANQIENEAAWESNPYGVPLMPRADWQPADAGLPLNQLRMDAMKAAAADYEALVQKYERIFNYFQREVFAPRNNQRKQSAKIRSVK